MSLASIRFTCLTYLAITVLTIAMPDNGAVPTSVEDAWLATVANDRGTLNATHIGYLMYAFWGVTLIGLAALCLDKAWGLVGIVLGLIMLLASSFLITWWYETSMESTLSALLWLIAGVLLSSVIVRHNLIG